jgi:hypothetical protein
VLAAGLSACSPHAKPKHRNAAVPAATASVCKLLTATQVFSATGTLVGAPTQINGTAGYKGGAGRGYDVCNFPSEGSPTFIRLWLRLGPQTPSGLAAEATPDAGCSPVAGVGTAAYFCAGGVMLALRGKTELDLSGARDLPEAALVNLATIAIGHV